MSEPASTMLYGRAPGRLPRRALTQYLSELERRIAGGRRFNCLLTDDRELRRLNRQFLDRDYATDVLSFPSAGPDGFLGELAISVESARAQAREHGHSLETEIKILMLHGVLHLLGLDHERDRGRMARAERRFREQLGLPSGLIERER